MNNERLIQTRKLRAWCMYEIMNENKYETHQQTTTTEFQL